MRFAYADPPYLGCGGLYAKDHVDALDWNNFATHAALVRRLVDEFPDGWVLSLSSPSLKVILPMCPDECRVLAWVKPFAVFKANVGLAYAWEPVILYRGRKIERGQPTVRDWLPANITLRRGLTGAKPSKFAHWIFSVLNVQDEDEFVDLFPGTGAVTFALEHRQSEMAL